MAEILEYLSSPHFNNTFKFMDKKLSKNVLKRCFVEPVEKIDVKGLTSEEIILLNEVFVQALKVHRELTPHLKQKLETKLQEILSIGKNFEDADNLL